MRRVRLRVGDQHNSRAADMGEADRVEEAEDQSTPTSSGRANQGPRCKRSTLQPSIPMRPASPIAGRLRCAMLPCFHASSTPIATTPTPTPTHACPGCPSTEACRSCLTAQSVLLTAQYGRNSSESTVCWQRLTHGRITSFIASQDSTTWGSREDRGAAGTKRGKLSTAQSRV